MHLLAPHGKAIDLLMDSGLDAPLMVDAQTDEGPSPWISLGPAHLLFWVVLVWPVVVGLIHRLLYLLPLGPAANPVSWIFTGVYWLLGGAAIFLGFKGQETENPGRLRRSAFLLALVIWLIRVAIGLLFRFQSIQYRDAWYTYLRVEPLLAPFFMAVPVVLLLTNREEQSGGTFDASVAALAMLGGLGFLGPFLLAFGALIGGHPLMAVAWDALRHPSETMKGEWFDGGDEGLKGRSFGQMGLAFVLGTPVLIVLPLVAGRFGQGGFDLSTQWIRPVAAWLTSLLLALAALRSMRRSGAKEGRGLAIATIVLFGLLLLPILLGIVLLILWSAHIFR